jgi:hypothetical protein
VLPGLESVNVPHDLIAVGLHRAEVLHGIREDAEREEAGLSRYLDQGKPLGLAVAVLPACTFALGRFAPSDEDIYGRSDLRDGDIRDNGHGT